MDKEGFLYILKKLFAVDSVTIEDNGTIHINQSELFIEINEFIPCSEEAEG